MDRQGWTRRFINKVVIYVTVCKLLLTDRWTLIGLHRQLVQYYPTEIIDDTTRRNVSYTSYVHVYYIIFVWKTTICRSSISDSAAKSENADVTYRIVYTLAGRSFIGSGLGRYIFVFTFDARRPGDDKTNLRSGL